MTLNSPKRDRCGRENRGRSAQALMSSSLREVFSRVRVGPQSPGPADWPSPPLPFPPFSVPSVAVPAPLPCGRRWAREHPRCCGTRRSRRSRRRRAHFVDSSEYAKNLLIVTLPFKNAEDSRVEHCRFLRGSIVSHSQITRLYSRFTSLDKGENGTLSREDFQRIPELAINPLGDRIINAFFPEGEDQVNFRGFMRTLAHFRPIEDNEKSKDQNGPEPLNSRSNKLHFAFRLYDLDKDDKISRDELLQVLRMMVGVNISDEQLGSIADRTIQEADQDGDSAISFTEFVKVLEKVDVEQKMSIRFLH